jgi:hypothetical protein
MAAEPIAANPTGDRSENARPAIGGCATDRRSYSWIHHRDSELRRSVMVARRW